MASEHVTSICSECGAPLTFPLGTMEVTCAHCDSGLVVADGQRLLRLDCPRCGGNFHFLDGALTGSCPYCQASLLALAADRVLRYVARPRAPRPAELLAGSELCFLPFWCLSGLQYTWDVGSKVEYVGDPQTSAEHAGGSAAGGEFERTVERRDSGPTKWFTGRVINLSIADPAAQALGVGSLRYRSATVALEPYRAEHEQLARTVAPHLDHPSAREFLVTRALASDAAAHGLNRVELRRSELIADSLSVVHYPFWIAQGPRGEHLAWDAVTGQPEPMATVRPAAVARGSEASIFDDLSVVELACTACGAPLTPENHPVCLRCAACGVFHRVTRHGIEPAAAQFASPRRPAAAVTWLPFWRFETTVRYAGRVAARAADLTGILGVLKPPTQLERAAPDSPLAYYAPAYGAMRAPRVDHAARDLTRLQPALVSCEAAQDAALFQCFHDEKDARRLAYVTFLQVLTVVAPAKLRSLRIVTGAASLWYLPFADHGRELENLVTGIRYDRVAFRGVRH